MNDYTSFSVMYPLSSVGTRTNDGRQWQIGNPLGQELTMDNTASEATDADVESVKVIQADLLERGYLPYYHVSEIAKIMNNMAEASASKTPIMRVVNSEVVFDALHEGKRYLVSRYWIPRWCVDLAKIAQDEKTNLPWNDCVAAYQAGINGDMEKLNAFIGYYELALDNIPQR